MRTEFGELTINTACNQVERRLWKTRFVPGDWSSMKRAARQVGATPGEISALKQSFESNQTPMLTTEETGEDSPQMPRAKDQCVIGMNYGRLVREGDGAPAIIFEYCPKCGNKFD